MYVYCSIWYWRYYRKFFVTNIIIELLRNMHIYIMIKRYTECNTHGMNWRSIVLVFGLAEVCATNITYTIYRQNIHLKI